jgi:hypothetical protein
MAQIQLFRDRNCSGVGSDIIEQDFTNTYYKLQTRETN